MSKVNGVVIPQVDKKFNPSWHLYVIRTKNRTELIEFLNKKGISTGIHYPIPSPFLEAYKYLNLKKEDFPYAYSYQNQLLSLPIFPELDNDKNKKLGAAIAGSIFFLFSYILVNGFDGEVVITSGSSTELLGEILLSRFVFPFELVSFVLLAALIGGITLARKDEALIDEDQV